MDYTQLTPQLILILAIILLGVLYYVFVARFWLRALFSGVRITQTEIIFMRMRKTQVNMVLTELIKAHKSGIPLQLNELETCHLAGGNVKNVVDGLIYAKAKDIELSMKDAMQLDQQKHDIVIYLRNK